MIRRYLFYPIYQSVLLCSLFLFGIQSVHAALSSEPIVSQPIGTVLSTQQGLNQDSIQDLLIDHDNFLWIATDGGLDRFDGHRVEHIVGPDGLLESTPIQRLFLDKQNRLWISTFYRGLYILDLATNELSPVLEIAQLDEPGYQQAAERFIELANGDMLVLFNQSLVLIDTSNDSHEVLYEIEVNTEDKQFVPYLRDILLSDNILLVATSEGLLVGDYSADKLNLRRIEHRSDVQYTQNSTNTKMLMLDDYGALLIGTVSGLFSVPWEAVKQANRSGSETVTGGELIISERNIWEMQYHNNNLIWIGSDIGLLRLQRINEKWQASYILVPSIGDVTPSRSDVRSIAITQDNNLWIGSYLNGALFWSPSSFNFKVLQNQGNNRPLSNNGIWSIYEDSDDVLWIGSGNGLTRYDQASAKSDFYLVFDGIPEPYSIHYIFKIMPVPASPDKLLLSTYNGILLFDKTTGDYEMLDFGLSEEEARYILGVSLGPNNDLYFFAYDFYRYNLQTKTLTRLVELKEQVAINSAMTFIGVNPLESEEMLLATYDGLWAYNVNTTQARQLHRLPERLIKAELWPDRVTLDGHILWVAYPGYGLVGLDAKTYEERYHFGRDVLGQAVLLFDLLEDDDGYFWFSSLNGIQRFSPTELTFTQYQYGRELSIAEFNQGAGVKLNDGRMVFGSPRGLVFFDPEKLNNLKKAQLLSDELQQMVITGISLSSRELKLPKQNLANTHIDLTYEDYGLSIEFSSLQYHQGRDTKYKYILSKGNQVLSEDITNDTQVILPSLAAGNYRFEVMPVSPVSERASMPASLTISMAYPPFLSPLAYTIYALVTIFLIGAYLVSRHLQILRLKQAQQQVKLFGNAFRHTSDWVVIFDEAHLPVAANPAFEKAFGINANERLDRQLYRVYQEVPKLEAQLSGQLKQLQDEDVWKGEEHIQMPDGRQYDVLIDINRMAGEKEGRDTHYLVVISNITEQKNAERKLVKIANFDNLTGLVNRSLLLERLEQAIEAATANMHTVAVMFVDLDRFKGINDSLGHDYGDKLLRVIANRMLNLSSKSDTVARLGGDEFVIVMEEVESEDAVSRFVAQLIESIETPISLGKEVLRVSCSVGISFFPNDATDPSELLKQADVAMYTAKKNTLSAFISYTKEMNERAIERLALENRVKSAYEEQVFENYYQPIVNLNSGKTEGVELLLRCFYNEEWISPAAFIPVLEELRHIIEQTRRATETAISDLQQWYADGYRGYISINLSALHFKTHFDLEFIEERLNDAGLPCSALRFEITEGVLIDQSEEVLHELERIRDAGFKLALDDFGTGYSSLSYLRRFPLDVLKVDKSFIDDVKESIEENALVQTTINLALSLKMDCIAEGIEHAEQVNYLLNHGCYRMQGFFFSRPVNATAIRPFLCKNWQTATRALVSDV